MRGFLLMITIAPLLWAFTWLFVYLVTRLPLDSPLRKLAGLVFVPVEMITISIQGAMVHVGHPHGAHAAAFVCAIAVDCLPAATIMFMMNHDQQKRINDGRLISDDTLLSLGL
ncbi:MAG: hypothetical protein ACRYFU_15115 [Janthinobacterium lividum]